MFKDYNWEEGVKLEFYLHSWGELQPVLSKLTDENLLAKLLKYEMDHKQRDIMISRIKMRLNKVRLERETREISEYVKAKKRNG